MEHRSSQKTPSLIEQFEVVKQLLSSGELSSELYVQCKTWIHDYVESSQLTATERSDLVALLATAPKTASAFPSSRTFLKLWPKSGWFSRYFEMIENTEASPVYHFFCAAVVFGAALQRRVVLPKIPFPIYGNLCVCLVGPTGICRKTSATLPATSLLRNIDDVTVLADQLTPQSLITSLASTLDATGLIYAPEFAVFLGKQRYMEGIVPLLTALFDCPDKWKSTTIMRGDFELSNIAVGLLAASTPDWLVSALPRDAFGGGFMSRILFIVQDTKYQKIPFPEPPPALLVEQVQKELTAASKITSTLHLTDETKEYYAKWYKAIPSLKGDQLAGYMERKPDHALRLTLILTLADDLTAKEIPLKWFKAAVAILDWVEIFFPKLLEAIESTTASNDEDRVLKILSRTEDGRQTHSILLRRSRMSAKNFRDVVRSLREKGVILEQRPNAIEHWYKLKE